MRAPAIVATPCLALLLLWPAGASPNSGRAAYGIARSVHDLTAPAGRFGETGETLHGWDEARGEICRACHMPHDRSGVGYGRAGILWNQQVTTKSSWRMYGSDPSMLSWIDGHVEPAPTGSSKLCLGCHDGVTAGNQYDGAGADSGGSWRTTSRLTVGNTAASLTNNHPISITYASGRDSQLRDPASAIMANGLSVGTLLENGRVECATCHDVHNSDVATDSAMLRPANLGANGSGAGASSLCLVCHDK